MYCTSISLAEEQKVLKGAEKDIVEKQFLTVQC